MRLFVAAEPSPEVRGSVAESAARLRRRLEKAGPLDGIRWIPRESLHLTVWFMGEVSDLRAAAVLDALRPPLATPRLRLRIAGFGAFPPTGAPRVLWMGVTEGGPELARAHDAVGGRLASLGFAPEGRAYTAHLTIARVKEPPRPAVRGALREAIARDRADAGACIVDTLTVFRSRTSPGGAQYEPLLRVPLS